MLNTIIYTKNPTTTANTADLIAMASNPPVPMRVTMVKPRVGVCKRTTRDLPPVNHVYGYTAPADAEGAGDCEFFIISDSCNNDMYAILRILF